MVMRLVALVLVLGCGRGPDQAARCRAAAGQGVDAMVKAAKDRLATSGIADDVRAKIEHNMRQMDDVAPKLRGVIETRCTADKWPNAVIECYARSSAFDEMHACRQKLPPDQQDKLLHDELALMQPDDPGSASRGSGRE